MRQMNQQTALRYVERRAAPRFPVRVPVKIRARDGGLHSAVTVNLSTGGMLISPPQDHTAPGEQLALDIGDVAHGVMVTVVGHRKQGTGLQFVDGHEGERLVLTLCERAQRSG